MTALWAFIREQILQFWPPFREEHQDPAAVREQEKQESPQPTTAESDQTIAG
jgi:hypothetical protein